MASISVSATRARLSRVERLAGMAARLRSASPACFFRCSATIASTPARCSASRSPRREVLRERPVPGTGPGLEGRDELTLVDQANLEREHAEEQVSRQVDRTRHDCHLPIGALRAPHVGPTSFNRTERAAHRCNCNDVRAGLPFAKHCANQLRRR